MLMSYFAGERTKIVLTSFVLIAALLVIIAKLQTTDVSQS